MALYARFGSSLRLTTQNRARLILCEFTTATIPDAIIGEENEESHSKSQRRVFQDVTRKRKEVQKGIVDLLNSPTKDLASVSRMYAREIQRQNISMQLPAYAMWMSAAGEALFRNAKKTKFNDSLLKVMQNKQTDEESQKLEDIFLKCTEQILTANNLQYDAFVVTNLVHGVLLYEKTCLLNDKEPNKRALQLLEKMYKGMLNPNICNIHTYNFNNKLIQFSNFHKTVSERSNRSKEVQLYLNTLLMRLFMSSESTFVTVQSLVALPQCAHTPEKWAEIVESRVTALADSMTSFDIANLIMALAEKSIRNPPLLRKLSQSLTKDTIHSEPFALKRITSVISAFRSLNFQDPVICSVLAKDILAQLPLVSNPRHLSALLTEMSLWSWHPSAVLHKISKWIHYQLSSFSHVDLATILAAFARINFRPKEGKLLETMRDVVLQKSSSIPYMNPVLQLEFAMACAVLEILTPEVVHSVISSQVVIKKGGKDDHRATVALIKLLNIVSCAHFDIKINIEEIMNELSKNVDAQATIDFFTKDCELELNAMGHIMPVLDWVNNTNCEHTKVAILVRTFHDYCHTNEEITQELPPFTVLTGANFLAKNIINKMGYKVVEIQSHDLVDQRKLTERVAIINSKIKQAMKDN